MERFSYPSLKALRKESTELLQLLEAESYGERALEKEELENQQRELRYQAERM